MRVMTHGDEHPKPDPADKLPPKVRAMFEASFAKNRKVLEELAKL